ncbi:MAG: hypothetical protein Q7T11_03200 [Deltaproteobacteria bacterium]|nr:hypothetical protein [Deltaproteobacteria bacterium]
MVQICFSFILLVALLSCGSAETDNGEDYGDLLASPEGLTLTEGEHEIGWGRSDCTTCHNLENIHLENRTSVPIDIEAVHDEALQEGEEGCNSCHGDNGV